MGRGISWKALKWEFLKTGELFVRKLGRSPSQNDTSRRRGSTAQTSHSGGIGRPGRRLQRTKWHYNNAKIRKREGRTFKLKPGDVKKGG